MKILIVRTKTDSTFYLEKGATIKYLGLTESAEEAHFLAGARAMAESSGQTDLNIQTMAEVSLRPKVRCDRCGFEQIAEGHNFQCPHCQHNFCSHCFDKVIVADGHLIQCPCCQQLLALPTALTSQTAEAKSL